MPPSSKPAFWKLRVKIGLFGRRVRRVHYGKLVLAIGIGTVGGFLLDLARMPLAWMIGAMLATSAAALARAPVEVPGGLRASMIMILGVMLGASFHPGVAQYALQWSLSLAFLGLYIVVCIVLGLWFLRRVARYDLATSYFTTAPGGFNEMVIIGSSAGGDERVIALSHTIRVMIVVLTIPLFFQMAGVVAQGDRPPLGPGLLELTWVDYALLASCVIGAPIAARLRFPAAMLIGPMIASAIIHVAGFTDSRPPALLIAAAQVVIGSTVGSRFAGTTLRELRRVFVSGIGLTILLLGVTVAFAYLVHRVTGLETAALVLAYAPGGLAEMSLIALAMQIDPTFVATHHIVRILLIVLLAPPAFFLMRRLHDRRAARIGAAPPPPPERDRGAG